MLGLHRSVEFSANSLETHKYNLWFKFTRHQTSCFSKEIFENC